MTKIFHTKWNEIWPIVNVLNEVCHGINIENISATIGADYNSIYALMKKIVAYESSEALSNIPISINLDDNELKILKNCFNEVQKQIQEWEFSTRIGVSAHDVEKILDRMTALDNI
ncbi:hypothetical protein [Simkania negevensis]|uniref:Uncharacterized protein n=1 Tax=Simkania negevensis (strain ATCC VR-1471 / DSM 27360 / Z) TaxID=331113 RepID=F8L672_SIMNZ|nr:hypothetical protein [Simkania negevensis]CCB90252.1 unknown protein [Simkania negevensis Z]